MQKRWLKAAASEVHHRLLAAHMKLFQLFEEESAEFASQLRPDFEQFLATVVTLNQEKPGKYTIVGIRARIPNNQWISLLDRIGPSPLPEVTRTEALEFSEAVRKRLQGKHLQ